MGKKLRDVFVAVVVMAATVLVPMIGLAKPASAAPDKRGVEVVCNETRDKAGPYGCVPKELKYAGAGKYGYDAGHNCTLYAAYRLAANGYTDPSGLGNANTWDDYASKGTRYATNRTMPKVRVDTVPAVGSIAQTDAGNLGHVAYVEEVHKDYIVVTEDSWGGVTQRLNLYKTGSYYKQFKFLHFQDLNEGKVLRASGGARAVVLDGQRQKLADYPTELCATYVPRRGVRAISDEDFNNVPDSGKTFTCDLNKSVLRASDKPEPKPSYAYHDSKRYVIQDGQTFQYLTQTAGYPLADLPLAEITDKRLADGGKEPKKLYAPNYVNKMLQLDGKDYVVGSDQQRHFVPDYQTMACGRFFDKKTQITNLSSDQVNSIPLNKTNYACSLDHKILRASDKPEPKPAWAYHDAKKYAITDSWTYDYYVRQKWPVVNMPFEIVNNSGIPAGGNETPKLDPASIPAYSIVNSNKIDYVVDANKQRHRIPYIQDDVCWRDLYHYKLVATGLTQGQLDKLPQKENYACIIGDRMVKSDDGSSWYVDKTNTRHSIPDADTYNQLIRDMKLEVVGPWPAADVNFLPKGSDRPQLVDKEAVKNSIVCRPSDKHCWAVDGNSVRHFIPAYADDVCWRWVNGWKVTRPNMNDAQAGSLGEADAWGCNLDGRIIATNEGAAYYMEGNTRRWIQDEFDFSCYASNHAVIRGMSMGEAQGIPEGDWMPMCQGNGYRVVSIFANGNSRYVSAEFGYGGNDYGMLRARNTGVGGWEQFRLIGDCNSSCLIQSVATRRLVAGEFGYEGYAWGEMRARSTSVGGWEQFRLVGDCNAGCGILALGNGRYVSTELDYTGNGYGMLRARATGVGGWERFIIR